MNAEQEAIAAFEGYRIDYTKIGAEYTGTDELKRKLLKAVAVMDSGGEGPGQWAGWLRVPGPGEPPLNVAMMPGEGIKFTIKELRLPNVSHEIGRASCRERV